MKKMKIIQLTVQSFVTSAKIQSGATVKGGSNQVGLCSYVENLDSVPIPICNTTTQTNITLPD